MFTTTPIRGLPVRERLVGSTLEVLAPGYTGQVKRLVPGQPGGRAAGDPLPLVQASKTTDTQVIDTLDIELTSAPTASDGGTGRSANALSAQIYVPQQADTDYALLQTDEYGVSRWIVSKETKSLQSGAALVFILPPTARSSDTGRGPITSAIRRIVRVVAWATAPLLGKAALKVAELWERSKRPYALKRVTSDGQFLDADGFEAGPDPTLLLIHGTFSTPEAGFHGWIRSPAFQALLKRYGHRCLALGHPSLSASPDENMSWFANQLAGRAAGPIDIVCHSRGGLVARVLAANDQLNVRRVCQVGTPNAGTPLAHAKHMIAFLDGYTALLTTLPDSVSTIVLEGLLCAIKLVVTGAGEGLPGLSAMEPDGRYLTQLGTRSLGTSQWFTIGANYQPGQDPKSSLLRRVGDAVVDRFFDSSNDLVVPSDGCHEPGLAPRESFRIDGADVHHTNYFLSAEVHDRLNRWLI